METHVRTPQDVLMQPQHLVVPPFQRPYVWEKEEQWAPLWQDVRRLAELRLVQPSVSTMKQRDEPPSRMRQAPALPVAGPRQRSKEAGTRMAGVAARRAGAACDGCDVGL